MASGGEATAWLRGEPTASVPCQRGRPRGSCQTQLSHRLAIRVGSAPQLCAITHCTITNGALACGTADPPEESFIRVSLPVDG
eukprot:2734151-Prymnesium_polylepis.1